MKKILLIATLLTAISCSHYDQKVKLDIAFDSTKENVGKGQAIDLTVVDRRADKEILGTKKFGDATVKITSDQDLAAFLQTRITENLLARGFKMGKGKDVEISIEEFKYKASRHFPTGKSKGNVTLRVVVKGGFGEKFTKNYEISVKNKHFVGPLQSTDERTINALLQDAARTLVNDEMFLQSLKK